MATGKSFPADGTMNNALSRTNAWVNRAGVVLDPTPVFGSRIQPELVQNDQGMPAREFPIPSELTTAILQMDASADQAEHQQAKEQARLLHRFQQLKQWQHQQQERLLQQQQEQLQMLRLEQQRVEQTLVAQRQKQWGGIQQIQQSPPRARNGPHQQRSPATSPHRSTIPEALGKASISLGQTAGPLVLNPLLMNVQRDEDVHNLRADLDLASEVTSSVAEEGVYPLPETASEMSYGLIEEDKDLGTLRNTGDKEEDEERLEDEGGMYNSLDESLQDAASFNQKMNDSDRPLATEQIHGDDRPIQSALGTKVKTFEELLEEQLKTETEKYQPSESLPQPTSTENPRQPFLRKGAGTARFGIISKKPPKPPSPRTIKTAPPGQESGAAAGKKTSAGKLETSKKNSSGGSQKMTSAARNKLSLVKPERREDDKRKGERGMHGKKEDKPQMARKLASKPPSVTKPSQDPLSKQVLAIQPKQTGHGSRNSSQGQEIWFKTPAIVVDTIPVSHSVDDHGQDLAREGALPDDTIEMSFQMRMKEWELNEQVEQEDLDEFELLEEAADDNASFTSDASVVVNMMQRAASEQRQGVPSNTLQLPSKSRIASQKQRQNPSTAITTQSKPHDESPDLSHDFKAGGGSDDGSFTAGDRTLTGEDETGYSPESKDWGRVREDGSKRREAGSTTEEDSDEMSEETEDGVLFESRRREAHGRHGDSEQNAEVNDERRSRDVAVEERGLEDDENDRDDDGKSYEDDYEDDSEGEAEKPSRTMKRKAATSSHAADVDFDDDESWGDFGDAVSESSDDNEDDYEDDEEDASAILAGAPSATSTPPPAVLKKGHKSVLDQRKESSRETLHPDAMASPPTSTLVSKLFPKLKPMQKTSQPSQDKVQAAQLPVRAPGPSVAEGLQSKLLKEKLVELDAEVAKFRRENAALAKLREEREKGLAALDKEVVDFQKLKAEELKKIQDYKEEEMRKLRKEKRTFEKYQKATRALPDKKDREEIELIKNQLSDLQEEMSRRETRWTAASTRLRDRTDILEKENAELREEVKLLEQQRLQAWRREEEKVKSNQLKPKQQVPIISKQQLPPLSSIPDLETKQDVKDTTDIKRETARDKPKAALVSSNAPAPARTQATNAKLDIVAAELGPTESCDDDTPLPSKPLRTSQRKRSVRFDFEDSPRKHPSITATADESLDVFSPTRDGGQHEAAVTASPKRRVDSKERKAREGNRSSNNNNEDEIHHPDGKIEEIRSDGSRVITYSNQTRKEISADGQSVIVTFFNGDIKQIMPDERVMYYYAETQATHTTYPDGLEIIKFSNNQTEKHYPNGTKEITFPDQTIKYLFPNGNEESIFPDGTVLRAERNGDRTMEFPNGQREVHTAQYKRREYPDGTVKTVYPDGRQETRYSCGRIRVKDKEGRVILDKK